MVKWLTVASNSESIAQTSRAVDVACTAVKDTSKTQQAVATKLTKTLSRLKEAAKALEEDTTLKKEVDIVSEKTKKAGSKLERITIDMDKAIKALLKWDANLGEPRPPPSSFRGTHPPFPPTSDFEWPERPPRKRPNTSERFVHYVYLKSALLSWLICR